MSGGSSVTGDNEEWKQSREDTSSNDRTVRHAGDDSKRQSEPEEVGPVDLHQVKPLVQLYPLREPLVFEAVEGVEQTLVDKVDSCPEDLNGKESKNLALDQEDYLHHH